MRKTLLLVALTACTSAGPEERYGFVTTLGNDTIAVESVTRQGNQVTTDEVDRFPRVRQRHTVIKLDDRGAIRHLSMDIHTPSESEAGRDRHVDADVTRDEVKVTRTDKGETVRRTFQTGGGIAMAHVPQMYSLYELYFQAALDRAAELHRQAGDTVGMRQFYIDREFDNFPLHRGTVRMLDSNKVEIRHDWLSGTGEATLDSAHRLLGYNGAKTTYDVRVVRTSTQPDVRSIGDRFALAESKAGAVKAVSPRDTVRASIGDAQFMIDYGRPLARGRVLLGNVIRYESVWRTGANAATQFSTSKPIRLGGLRIPAGMYTLWSVAHANGAELIVNKQTGQWGTDYNRALNLGRIPLGTETLSKPVEQFTMSIVPRDSTHGTLLLEWGNFHWSAQIEVP